MRLLIARHGETLQNEQGLIQGQSEGTLSEKGVQQSRALARRVLSEAPDHAYCSDLIRARGTMEEILRCVAVPCPCTYTKDLRELALGELEGKPVALYAALFKSRKPGHWPACPEGGESYDSLKARTEVFLRSLVPVHHSHTVLVCSHFLNIRCLIGALMKLSVDEICALRCSNASLSILELDENLAVMTSVINDTSHLEHAL